MIRGGKENGKKESNKKNWQPVTGTVFVGSAHTWSDPGDPNAKCAGCRIR